jgi:hypothetical protein
MNFKTTLILLVLLVVVGTIVFFTNRSGDTNQTTDTKNETERKVLALDTADVEQITVEQPGGEKFTLERKGSSPWRLTAPVSAATDTWSVDSLVREVAELKSRNRVSLDAAAQGLAKPAYTVTLRDKAGKTHTLAVGSRSAIGDTLYVKLDTEDKAQVVPGSLVEQLAKPAMSYRQPKLVETTQDQVEGITVARTGEPAIKVDRASFTEWKMTEPMAMSVEPSEVTGLITAVTGMSATEFVAEDAAAKAAQYGLDKPQLIVTLRPKPPATQPAATQVAAPTVGSSTGGATTKGTAATAPTSQPAPIVIRFGRYVDVLKKDVYAAVEGGPVVKLPVASLENFKKTPLELRDRKLIDIDPESVERVTITRDLLATTQPSKRDASKATIVIARRQEKFAPAGPPAPAKKPDEPKPAGPAGAKSDASSDAQGEAILAAAEEKADAAKTDAAKADAPRAGAPKADATKAEGAKTTAVAASPASAPASAPTTKPSTGPSIPTATAPTSQPAPPPPPPSKFVLESEPKGDAADSKVQALLDSLHPLRVQKYLAGAPKDAKSVGTYVLKVQTASSGGKPAQSYEIRLSDSGSSGAVTGQYGDVHFEVERFLLAKLEGGFEKGAAPAEAPGGFQGGFPGAGGAGLGIPGE